MARDNGGVAGPFLEKVGARRARIGIIGMGYVGLPLGIAFARAGFPVIAFDTDKTTVDAINGGKRYIGHIEAGAVAAIRNGGGRATASPADLSAADAVLLCVPTPLSKQREPDMSHIVGAAEMLCRVMRKGQVVILESTTYPGTTREVLLPILEKSGLVGGRDFLLAYSPEREDPGRAGHSAAEIPKVVGGLTAACLAAARGLYGGVLRETVPVSSLEAAEATKLLENIFRSVNIAMVNELKQIFSCMDIDIWEVVAAARTKPFGFMPFYPGPGLGGHCLPIDPFYLAWKAREFGCAARFIELAGEINTAMPEYVVARIMAELNRERKCLKGSRVLVVGLAYKRDVDDVRESPGVRIMELLLRNGSRVDYHDPHVPALRGLCGRPAGKRSVPLTEGKLAGFDAVVIATDHSAVDYGLIARSAKLVIDTRNAMAGVDACAARVAKA